MHFKNNAETQSLKKDLTNANCNINDLAYDFNNLLPTSLIDDLDSLEMEKQIQDNLLCDNDNTEFENKLRKASLDSPSPNIVHRMVNIYLNSTL